MKGNLQGGNPFKAATKPGQLRNIWFCDGQCTFQNVCELVNGLIDNGRKVHLIYGVHSDPQGGLNSDQTPGLWEFKKEQLEHHQDNIIMVAMTPVSQIIVPLDKSRSVVLAMNYGKQAFE